MQGLTREQKTKFNQSIPGLGTIGSGKSAGEIIDSLFKLGGAIVNYTSNATANTQDTVPHGLGYTPQGYIVIGKNVAADVYIGTAADDNNLYLKCTVASASLTLLVF
ncbi:hypothetical protein SD70_02480 [Gordoniibacillus kamchatkensis]|uniref:Uncharacterized protein n=1 Tax=Gordoniibacillus kamchatkensis TaxID=1590651 RepID=A0ABR5AM34_9BACL|nr:hypothetical protein [Paenibacillus sp. VKM B-2647]KIL42069.1 hypothetical protein SD70_02480 [Paenibacillus sp. VKM B-2647]